MNAALLFQMLLIILTGVLLGAFGLPTFKWGTLAVNLTRLAAIALLVLALVLTKGVAWG